MEHELPLCCAPRRPGACAGFSSRGGRRLRVPSRLCRRRVGEHERAARVIAGRCTEPEKEIPTWNLPNRRSRSRWKVGSRLVGRGCWWRHDWGNRKNRLRGRVWPNLPRGQPPVDVAREMRVLSQHMPAHADGRLDDAADRTRRRSIEWPHQACGWHFEGQRRPRTSPSWRHSTLRHHKALWQPLAPATSRASTAQQGGARRWRSAAATPHGGAA